MLISLWAKFKMNRIFQLYNIGKNQLFEKLDSKTVLYPYTNQFN